MSGAALTLLRSFLAAINGVCWALRTQRNIRIHLAATVFVTALAWVQHLAAWEWCALALAMALVWMAELFNTALEVLCDRITLERDEHIRRAKDIAAGTVLVTAFFAIMVGCIVFF